MRWHLSHQCDPRAIVLADKHYSRKTIGAPSFMPPGRQLVLLTAHADALWGTSWPYAHLLRRKWARTAWMCAIFRNESCELSSELILEAVAATRYHWGEPPPDGMVTMIDAGKVRSANPGYCYKKAGFKHFGFTQKGLVIVQLLPDAMPAPRIPNGATYPLFDEEIA